MMSIVGELPGALTEDREVHGFLGSGTYGEVWNYGNHALKKPAFFTLLDDEDGSHALFLNAHARECFASEIRILRHIGDQAGIVKIFNISNASVENGIEMELLENGDLHRYIIEKPEPDKRLKFQWILQIAESVALLHKKGVIHGDMKCDNIMFDRHQRLKIIDFSVSIFESERAADERVYTFSRDIFDFATLAYEVLTWKMYDKEEIGLELWEYLGENGSKARIYETPNQWPRECDLPQTQNVTLGSFLLQCWLRKFDDMRSVCAELRKCIEADERASAC